MISIFTSFETGLFLKPMLTSCCLGFLSACFASYDGTSASPASAEFGAWRPCLKTTIRVKKHDLLHFKFKFCSVEIAMD